MDKINLKEEPVALLHGAGSIIVLAISFIVVHYGINIPLDVQWQIAAFVLLGWNALTAFLSRSKVEPVVRVERDAQEFLKLLAEVKPVLPLIEAQEHVVDVPVAPAVVADAPVDAPAVEVTP